MEKDLDKKLYNDYLNGEKQAFEYLYRKYKSRIKCFIYNIVKDYQKAEDLTQETFIYVMQNKVRENKSFKYFIYLVAKSKAYNYIKIEKRRKEISEIYLENNNEPVEKDVLEIIAKEETKKELLESIECLDERYRNAIYLVNIEGFSYEETSKILGETLQNTKNLIYRGRAQLRKKLLKKGFDEMSKLLKMVLIIISTTIILTGITYASIKIYEKVKGEIMMTPNYTSKISSVDSNKVWIGTFNLVWNDFMDEVIGGPVEFENYYSELANELNAQSFKVDQLNENSYYKIQGETSYELKNKIEDGIMKKFKETSTILDKIEWGNPQGYILYAMLKKEFNYIENFPILSPDVFGDSEEKIKYFGIDSNTRREASENIKVLFYNSSEDFAVQLKTKEGDEVILYKTVEENKSFKENYKELIEKEKEYTGSKIFEKSDIIKIPFISLKAEINYDELCGKKIKGSEIFIRQALQTVEFDLNNCGGSVKSEAAIEVLEGITFQKGREFIYNNDFILYLKEEQKENPYFALEVDNSNILLSEEN